jgi:hypothetical protein
MPGQHRSGLDQPSQSQAWDQAAEGSHDRAIGGRQLGSIDLTAQNSKLVAQEQQFGFGVVDPKPDVGDVQKETDAGVSQGEEH